jgi:hypothetical protein
LKYYSTFYFSQIGWQKVAPKCHYFKRY